MDKFKQKPYTHRDLQNIKYKKWDDVYWVLKQFYW